MFSRKDSKGNRNKQIRDIEDQMTKDCVAMIVSAATGETPTSVVEKAMDMCIQAITLERTS